MKKLLSVFLACSLILSAICGVAAAEEKDMYKGGFRANIEGLENLSKVRSITKSRSGITFEQSLKNQLLAHNAPVVLDDWYDYYTAGILGDVMRKTIFSDYRILVYATTLSLNVNGYGQLVYSPNYILNSYEEDEAARADMYSAIQEYLNAASEIPDSDVVGKMLVIHDLFCKNNEYAHEELAEEEEEIAEHPDIYTAYGLFYNHRAVCQGNAIAMKAIYDALNDQLKTDEDVIVTDFCKNKTHIWNVVKINGKWYHIDETNDDFGNYALHDKFLVSSSSLHASAYSEDKDFFGPEDSWTYYVFDENIECNNDDYESGYIFNTLSDYFRTCSISYNDAHYILNPNTSNYDKSFLFDSILATKAFATDVYNAEGQDRVDLFLGDSFNASVVFANYDENGSLIDCKKMPKTLIGGYLDYIYDFSEYSRIFVWQAGGIEPLCRVIDIPAAE